MTKWHLFPTFSRFGQKSADKASGAQIFASPLRNPQSPFSLGLESYSRKAQKCFPGLPGTRLDILGENVLGTGLPFSGQV